MALYVVKTVRLDYQGFWFHIQDIGMSAWMVLCLRMVSETLNLGFRFPSTRNYRFYKTVG